MIIYLLTYLVSFFIYKKAWDAISDKIKYIILSFLAILIPSLLAGFRDTTVGHDIEIYMVPLFDSLCESNSFANLSSLLLFSGLEEGFVIFNYLISLFTNDIFWSFFIQQLIVLTLVITTCYRMRDYFYGPHFYLIYLLFGFAVSMTMARQVFAVAVMIYAIPFIIQRKIISFLFCVLIGYFLHHSTILTLFLYFLPIYSSNVHKNSVFKLTMIFIFGVLLYASFPVIVAKLISYGILPEKYERYLDSEFLVHKTDLLITIAAFYLSTKYNILKQLSFEIQVLAIIITFMLLCGEYNDVAQRIALYYIYYMFAKILMLFSRMDIVLSLRLSRMFIVLLFFIFIFLALKYGYAEAIPYTSSKLGIY